MDGAGNPLVSHKTKGSKFELCSLATERDARTAGPAPLFGKTLKTKYLEVIKTAIEGVVIIEPRIFEDSRGYFFESFSQREFEEILLQSLQDIWISIDTFVYAVMRVCVDLPRKNPGAPIERFKIRQISKKDDTISISMIVKMGSNTKNIKSTKIVIAFEEGVSDSLPTNELFTYLGYYIRA